MKLMSRLQVLPALWRLLPRLAVLPGTLCLSVVAQPHRAAAADITYDLYENRTGLPSLSLHLQGTIESGDADRMATIVAAVTHDTRIEVTFDSPGGSLVEGLRIGRYLASLPGLVVTRVFTPSGQQADCASACVFSYLGGDYRFLAVGSRLGVHQFYFGSQTDMTGAQTSATAQILSAEISDFLASANVGAEFLRIIADVPPDQIYWAPVDVLERYKVVTGLIHDQTSQVKLLENGQYYIRLEQTSYYGQNKVIAGCDKGVMHFDSYIQPVDIAAFDPADYQFQVMIDGVQVTPASVEPQPNVTRWAVTAFTLAPAQLVALRGAKSFGARHDQHGMFVGFEYQIEDDQLANAIAGCLR